MKASRTRAASKWFGVAVATVAMTAGSLTSSLVLAPPAHADGGSVTSFSFTSQPGDYIGQGTSATYTPGNAQLTLYSCGADAPNAGCLMLGVRGSDGTWWYATLQAPSGQQLHQGVYTNVSRARVGDSASPRLDVYGDGRGCDQVYGQFQIAHITADATGAITVFDASFTQYCDNQTAPALTGRIQYQAPEAAPVSVSVSNSSTVAGQPVTVAAVVYGQGTTAPTGTVTFSDGWTVLGQAPVDANGYASLTSSTLAVGTHSIEAIYSGDTANPAAIGGPVSEVVLPSSTSYYFVSGEGDWVGQGATASYSTSSLALPTTKSSITMGGNPTDVTISVQAGGQWWRVELAAPSGQLLHPGTYVNAQGAALRSAGSPGLDVSGQGRGCDTVSGTFVINTIVVDPSGVVGQLDATFVQNCEGSMPPLRGFVRYHMDLPA